MQITLPDAWQPYMEAMIADIEDVSTRTELVRHLCKQGYNQWKTQQLAKQMQENIEEYNQAQQDELQDNLQDNLI